MPGNVWAQVSDLNDPKQVELLELAKEKNVIVYLGTGSGKTFIAAMLMKHMKDKLIGGLQKVKHRSNVVYKTYLYCQRLCSW